ncbi:kinase-like domain-containing protein [Mycena epipterygia]|nr:kinase-like domain-containing protein [Mycena epipterygia]
MEDPTVMDSEDIEHVPETQEQRQPTPPPTAEDNPNLWGCLQRYPGNRLVPQQRYDLYKDRPEVTIGRDPRNTICIPNSTKAEGTSVSAFHAKIRWGGVQNGVSQVTIEDNASKNRTFVEGARVRPGIPRTLKHEAEISFAMPQIPPPGNTTMQDFRFIYHDLASPKRGVLEDYQLQEEVGFGCFARVYKAYNRQGNLFAVKSISGDNSLKLRWNTEGQTMTSHEISVKREIDIMKKLDHPNVCRLRDHFWNADGSIDLVLDYIAGGDLYTFINRYNGLSERMTKHLMRQLCEALAFIHSNNITHRDLKPDARSSLFHVSDLAKHDPQNILLTTDRPPVLKIADFGLAKMVDYTTRLQSICGTPMYLAPEFVLHMFHQTGYHMHIDCFAAGGISYNCIRAMRAIYSDLPEGPYLLEHVKLDRTIDWASLDHHILSIDQEGYPVYLSSEGRRFIRGLMDIDPKSRMNMSEALEHAWFHFDQADSYIPPPIDACDELTSSLQDVTMQTSGAPEDEADSRDVTPNTSRRNATITPAHLFPQEAELAAPGLMLLQNKGRALERQRDVLERARQSQQLPSREVIQQAQLAAEADSLRGAEVCAEAGPSGASKRKHSALTPPAGDTGTARNTPLRNQASPTPEPLMKKGKNVDPDEMDFSPGKKRLGRRR